MNIKRIFLGMAGVIATMAMFTACSQNEAEDIAPIGKSNVISLTSSMETMRAANELQTNAINTSVKVGAFGVSGSATITNGNNNEYTVESTGSLTATNEMAWPSNTSAKVNIYAYAPYQSNWAYNSANAFAVNTDQSSNANYLASDLLYAKATDQSQTTEAIALNFTHKLSRINVTIKKGEDASAVTLNGAKVYITNTYTATTLNPSTGALAEAPSTAADILIGTLSAEPTATGTTLYGITIPQAIAAATKLVKVTTTDKVYVAKLGSATTLEGGKSYNFTATIGTSTEATLTLGSVTLTGWGDATDLGSATMEEVISYEIGDYVLTDGTFMKASAYDTASAEDKAKVAGIIFSKEVSTIDAAAGYNAYAVGLSRKKQSFTTNTDYPDQMCTPLLGTSFADAFADLDGRTRTSQMLTSSYYNALDENGKAAFIGNLSWYTKTVSANASGWFLPSFGQLMRILNLGGASITSSSITVESSTAEVTCLDATQEATVVEALLAKITAAGGANDVFKKGNIDYASSSENGSANNTGHSGKIWGLKIKAANNDANWNGLTVGRHYSRGTTQYSVVPCIAVTLPTE
ncbi:MAG: fimbrillin family protein [Prevotella sp.]|nr:fimbrillin family protein [Prevotella sp.]